MAINVSKVVVGGLAAGVVGNIVGYVAFGMLLAPRMQADAVAVDLSCRDEARQVERSPRP
jgi:hypothetical protein